MVSQAKLVALNTQVDDLCENFGDYLAELNADTAFTDKYLSHHKRTIDKRKELGGVAESIASDEYMRYLYDTVDAFGMNKQSAKMQKRATFVDRIREYQPRITALDGKGVAQIDEDTAGRLWRIIGGMELSQTKSQMVTGAKALHHLLPQLLPPIDRRYTYAFFRYYDSQVRQNPEAAFRLILSYFARIAQRVDLGRYVGTAPWATSESKLIDNAIIGYCNLHPGLHKYLGTGKAKGIEAQIHIAGCRLCQM